MSNQTLSQYYSSRFLQEIISSIKDRKTEAIYTIALRNKEIIRVGKKTKPLGKGYDLDLGLLTNWIMELGADEWILLITRNNDTPTDQDRVIAGMIRSEDYMQTPSTDLFILSEYRLWSYSLDCGESLFEYQL